VDDRFEQYRDALKQGHMAALRGKHREALQAYQAAAAIAGERAQPHASMGNVLLAMGKTKDAIGAYRRAVELAPEDADSLARLAEALRADGQLDEADQLSRRATEMLDRAALQALAPSEELSALPPAERLHLTGHQARLRGDTQSAIGAWLDEARTHAQAGHLDAALDACQQALALSSGSVRVHLELIRLYFERGWHELAVERVLLLDRLLELAPEPEAQNALATLVGTHAASDERLAAVTARTTD
jgi:tetratricopeptide (TPR) repeat protein